MNGAVRTLYVLYDGRCGLCSAIKDWLNSKPKLVPLYLVPADSQQARRLLNGSPPPLPDQLVVVSDAGWVWQGDHAWVVVLWALRDYRHWSTWLSKAGRLPLARRAFATLSNYRGAISACFGLEAHP
jgi:predicted DCC family thiol-disulfide oxidoreductase YuxK